jgi:hypothetical protein
MIAYFFPDDSSLGDHKAPLALGSILDTLKADWINGTALADQKRIAKSLIKLQLNPAAASAIAKKTGVDESVLSSVVAKMASGAALTQQEADVSGRLDLILMTALDEGYQRADQRYRNACKSAAVLFSVGLALFAAWAIHGGYDRYLFLQALVVGLLATPLAPVAKDLSTAVQTASKAVSIFEG